MTELLERALSQVSKLPPSQQEEIAAWILAELEDEGSWGRSFSSSQGILESLADKALAEHEAGLTQPLDPKTL